MPHQLHPATWPEEQLLTECDVKRTRGSGPGGQHRNKVETAVVVTHSATGIKGQASEKRSQHANREVAVERLRINLAIQHRHDTCQERTPSEIWNSRIRNGKISVSRSHFDFASLLAEAIDFIASENFDVAVAARRLGVSTSQLNKFLKAEPMAFQSINSEREKRDLHRLK